MGAWFLSRALRRDRWRSDAQRCVRWLFHKSPRHRPRGPHTEYFGRALAHTVLQKQLPAFAEREGALGSAQRVSAPAVDTPRLTNVAAHHQYCHDFSRAQPMPPTPGNGKICYLEIPTTDIARSVAFYQAV